MKTMNHPSKLIFRLADSSYSVYLFHPLFVVLFAKIYLALGIGGMVGLASMTILVAAASYAVHGLIVKKSPLLLFLYNGISKPRPQS